MPMGALHTVHNLHYLPPCSQVHDAYLRLHQLLFPHLQALGAFLQAFCCHQDPVALSAGPADTESLNAFRPIYIDAKHLKDPKADCFSQQLQK